MTDSASHATRSKIVGGVGDRQAHDSARKHVTGSALFVDDIREPEGTLHAYLGLATVAHANIVSIDLSDVRAAPGVVDVLTDADIVGINDISPTGQNDEPVLASKTVQFYGQPIFIVVARARNQARHAARRAKVRYEELPSILDIDGLDPHRSKLVTQPLRLSRGDVETALESAPRRIRGAMRVGGQEHFYLEGQVALAIPGEDGDMVIHSSTQHPSEVQHMVARVLNTPMHAVSVEVRRMGGAFGGKETQATQFAAVAAIAASRLKCPVKIRPDRDDDMTVTGKRHDFAISYDVGFDDDGNILGVDYVYASRCGFSSDLSRAVSDLALLNCDNAYYWPAVRALSAPFYTNTVSNTAFRGFGAPQGMIGAERVIEEVAFAVGLDPLEVRKRNFYASASDSGNDRKITPYHQPLTDNILPRIVAELARDSDYYGRRRAISEFNAQNRILKKGLALTPVKFGISFTAIHFNQAGALVHVYNDGSVHLNHGGTEMGQGLNVKVAQVVADEFQIDLNQVKITATTTGKVPNTSPTAASSGSDLNGMAAQNAARQIKDRLIAFALERYQVGIDQIVFRQNRVLIGNQEFSFRDIVKQAYLNRVHLSAAGFYKTPKIFWDRENGKGNPYYYFAYGAACSEVLIDTLTGEYTVERADVLHDVGRSLNPAIDMGQVEGGFIQGMGWLTTEELWWDDKGKLRTHAPSTYKIPLASDRPRIFNVNLVNWSEAQEPTIHRSKAVGEPPFPLAISVLHALSDAVASVANHKICPQIDPPATPERILFAVERIKRERESAARYCAI